MNAATLHHDQIWRPACSTWQQGIPVSLALSCRCTTSRVYMSKCMFVATKSPRCLPQRIDCPAILSSVAVPISICLTCFFKRWQTFAASCKNEHRQGFGLHWARYGVSCHRRVKGWSCSNTARATATQLSPWKMSFKVTVTFLPILLSSILGSFTNRESLSKANFSQTTEPTSPSNVDPGLNAVTLNGRGRTGVNASTTGSAAQDQKQCSHPAEAGFEKGMDGYTTDNSSGNVKWEIWPKAGNQHWPRISRFISPPPFSGELSLEPARRSTSTCNVLFFCAIY